MRALLWLLRIGLFFLLFALALNNQHEVALKSLFGHEWRAPMIFIVLSAFLCGCALGVCGMLPTWWRRRRLAPVTEPAVLAAPQDGAVDRTASIPEAVPEHPPRDGI